MKEKINIFLVLGLVFILGTLTVFGGAEPITIMLNNPPYEPFDPNPADGASDIGIFNHVRWTGGDPDTGDRVVYDLYFGTTQPPSLIAENIPNPNYILGELAFHTTYYWKVIAEDRQNATTEGPLWSFTTELCDNDPPNKPDVPSGPTRARHRYTYEYCTRTSDQNNDGLYYNWSWGDGNYSGWLGPYENRERCSAQYNWSQPGSYQVRVKASDGPRNETIGMLGVLDESDWSDPLTVIVTAEEPTNTPPSTPSINGETDGKAGTTYRYSIMCTDKESDDVFYTVQWGDSSEDTYSGPYFSDEIITLDHVWSEQGTYSMKIMASDVYAAESQWATLEVQMPLTTPLPGGNGLMQRLRNRICDTMGICQGGCTLVTIEGILTFDGTDFYVNGVELHFGPIWYITSAVSAYDYDGDGTKELIYDEFQGLVGITISVEGHMQSEDWMSVFSINGMVYREPGSPIWASQHQYRWRHGPNTP
jgi:hypothetical protein